MARPGQGQAPLGMPSLQLPDRLPDWRCPNSQCKNSAPGTLLCFGSKPKCKLCGARNPVFAQRFSGDGGGGGGTPAHKKPKHSYAAAQPQHGQLGQPPDSHAAAQPHRSPHHNLRPKPNRPPPPGVGNTATAAATAQLTSSMTSSTTLPRLQKLRKELESAPDPAVKELSMTVREICKSYAATPPNCSSVCAMGRKFGEWVRRCNIVLDFLSRGSWLRCHLSTRRVS